MDKWYLSSTGSGNVSLTIKGVLVGLLPLAVAIAKTYGVELPAEDITEIITNVFEVVAAVTIIIGIGRKIKARY